MHKAATRAFYTQAVDGFWYQHLHIPGQPQRFRLESTHTFLLTQMMSQHETAIQIGNILPLGEYFNKLTLIQRMILIDKPMVCCQQHIIGVVTRQFLEQLYQLFQGFLHSQKCPLFTVTGIARLVDDVLIDIEHIMFTNQ